MTVARQLRFVLLGIITLAWLGMTAEALCRLEGNWRFDHLTLTKGPERPSDPALATNAERVLVEQITYQKDVDPTWFFLPPAPLKMPQNPELKARTEANPSAQGLENFIWNEAFLARPSADFVTFIKQHLKAAALFAFPSYDGSPLPRYRLYPDSDFSPTPWVTNRWGWLGTDAGVRKPPHTVRVGIIGDSTSHNMYALNLQSFLQTWANHHGYNVRFEVFSVARQGLENADELAALKYELAPMGLDYVYQYFAPAFAVQGDAVQLFSKHPAGETPEQMTAARHPVRHAIGELFAPLTQFSALARRTGELITREPPDGGLPEPVKPRARLSLPPGTKHRVVLDEARKDPYFGALIGYLETLKRLAEATHTVPFVATERVCAWDATVLRNDPDGRRLYGALNGPLFWPLTYAQIRETLAAHNDVIKAWARTNGVAVVDIDGRMPPSPELCVDAMHDTEFGHQMRAWLIFEAMVPQLEHDLRIGVAPRANGIDSDIHPYLSKPIERVDRKAWLAKIEGKSASSASAK